jgi:hypothetical protein
VPFDFLRRRKPAGEDPPPSTRPAAATRQSTLEFEALTEEWRLSGRMSLTGQLTDALNRREPIAIADVRWAPLDGSADPTAAPGLKSVDPYDLIVVIAGESREARLSDAERAARTGHKVAYDVALELPPFRVVGTVRLNPGSEPDRLLDRGTEMFVPVVDGVASLGDRVMTAPEGDALLVNRFYLRGVEQIDKRTGERHQKLPGQSLGGVSWRERSR